MVVGAGVARCRGPGRPRGGPRRGGHCRLADVGADRQTQAAAAVLGRRRYAGGITSPSAEASSSSAAAAVARQLHNHATVVSLAGCTTFPPPEHSHILPDYQ